MLIQVKRDHIKKFKRALLFITSLFIFLDYPMAQNADSLAIKLYEQLEFKGEGFKEILIYNKPPVLIHEESDGDGIPIWIWVTTGIGGGGIITYLIVKEGDSSTTSEAPIARNDEININCNGSGNLNVLTNDSGSGIEVSNIINTSIATITHSPNGSVSISGVGSTSFTFSYSIVDDQNRSVSATITVNVVVNPISALDDEFSFNPGATASGNVLTNDTGDNIQVINHSNAVNGNVNISSDGSLVYTPNAGFCGQEIINYTIIDDCGQETTAMVHISGIDQENPTLNCPVDITIDCSGPVDPSTTGQATANDNCSSVEQITITYEDDESGLNECNGTGIIIRNWMATDAAENSTSCAQQIRIIDDTAPGLTCPTDIQLPCGSDYDTSITGIATAEDLCGGVTVEFEDDLIGLTGCNDAGIIIRIWTATDECGNTTTCEQSIEIMLDTEAPTIECPEDIEISCDESTDPSNTGEIIVSDNCSSQNQITITYGDSDPDPTACNSIILRIWTVTDACGNTASCEQNITIEDHSPPIITCPADINIPCTSEPDPSITGTPIVEDDCGNEQVSISFVDEFVPDGSCSGVITRTWTVIDNCGQTATCTQNIFLAELSCDFTFSITTSNADCGVDNGEATITLSPGPNAQGPFSIFWSDGQSGMQAIGLGSGFYQVTIVDNGINCSQSADFEINQDPPDLVDNIQTILVGCDNNNGNILFDLQSPGPGPMQVFILLPGGGAIDIPNIPNNSTFSLSDWLPNPPPGEYIITITDQSMGNTCAQTIVIFLEQTPPLTINVVEVFPTSSPTANDGQIVMQVGNASGVPPFTVFVNDNPIGTVNTFDFVINGVPVGFYIIFIIDSQGCISNTVEVFMEAGGETFQISLNQNKLKLSFFEDLEIVQPAEEATGYETSNISAQNSEAPIIRQTGNLHFSWSLDLNSGFQFKLDADYIKGNWHLDSNLGGNLNGIFEIGALTPHLRWSPQTGSSFRPYMASGVQFHTVKMHQQSPIGNYKLALTQNNLLKWFASAGIEFPLGNFGHFQMLSELVKDSDRWMHYGQVRLIQNLNRPKRTPFNSPYEKLKFPY